MKVSVIVPTRNEERRIKPFLESVLPVAKEIILIDNSTDNTCKIAKKYKGVKIIKSDVQDFSYLRNLGIKHAKSKYILSLDTDEILTEELKKEILALKDDKEIIGKLASIYREKILIPCTGCEYCMPCPDGVNIPQNFAILNDSYMNDSGWHRFTIGRGYKRLAGLKEKLDKDNQNGNASLCTRCNECLEKCPQEIAIPDELEKVHSVLGKRGRLSDYFKVKK